MNCPNCRSYISKETLRCPYCGYSFAATKTVSRAQSSYSTYPLYTTETVQPSDTEQGTYPVDTQIYWRGGYVNNNRSDQTSRGGRYASANSQKHKISTLRVLFPLGLMIIALQTLILLLQIIILCK